MTIPAKISPTKINRLFSQVSSTYQHQHKSLRPGPALVTNDVYLKFGIDRTTRSLT